MKKDAIDTMQAIEKAWGRTPGKRPDGLVRRLVVPNLIWLLVIIATVAAHHIWFDIGERGTVQAGIDGAFLAALVTVTCWLRGKVFRHNAKALTPPTETEDHE